MKLTLIGNGIMAQSLARGLIKNHEVEIIGRDISKLKTIQKNNSELQDELVYMEDVKKYYDEVIVHIEKNLLKEEEAIQILEDLEDMRADDDDEV